jgi:hypothetical protein
MVPRTPRPSSRHSFRELGRLARAGLAGHDHDLVGGDRLEQVLAAGADRQLRRIGDRRHGRTPPRDPLLRLLELGGEAPQRLGVAAALDVAEPAAQPVLVAQHDLAEAGAQRGGRGRGGHGYDPR